MNRYQKTFKRLAAERRIAFVPFAVAGDPDIDASTRIFKTFLDAGADILEIGYPFSDPVADGPINQRAAQRAIAAGLTHSKFFTMIRNLRSTTDVPFGLLLYANTMYHLGLEKFCAQAADAGIDSILVADMPPEESTDLLRHMNRYGLQSVFIVSELTSPERIKYICSKATGFIYVVSRLGTTGVQTDFNASVRATISRLRRFTNLPLCVGFGISSNQHVAQVRAAGADGAIVGSRLVSLIESQKDKPRKMLMSLATTIRDLCQATHIDRSKR